MMFLQNIKGGPLLCVLVTMAIYTGLFLKNLLLYFETREKKVSNENKEEEELRTCKNVLSLKNVIIYAITTLITLCLTIKNRKMFIVKNLIDLNELIYFLASIPAIATFFNIFISQLSTKGNILEKAYNFISSLATGVIFSFPLYHFYIFYFTLHKIFLKNNSFFNLFILLCMHLTFGGIYFLFYQTHDEALLKRTKGLDYTDPKFSRIEEICKKLGMNTNTVVIKKSGVDEYELPRIVNFKGISYVVLNENWLENLSGEESDGFIAHTLALTQAGKTYADTKIGLLSRTASSLMCALLISLNVYLKNPALILFSFSTIFVINSCIGDLIKYYFKLQYVEEADKQLKKVGLTDGFFDITNFVPLLTIEGCLQDLDYLRLGLMREELI